MMMPPPPPPPKTRLPTSATPHLTISPHNLPLPGSPLTSVNHYPFGRNPRADFGADTSRVGDASRWGLEKTQDVMMQGAVVDDSGVRVNGEEEVDELMDDDGNDAGAGADAKIEEDQAMDMDMDIDANADGPTPTSKDKGKGKATHEPIQNTHPSSYPLSTSLIRSSNPTPTSCTNTFISPFTFALPTSTSSSSSYPSSDEQQDFETHLHPYDLSASTGLEGGMSVTAEGGGGRLRWVSGVESLAQCLPAEVVSLIIHHLWPLHSTLPLPFPAHRIDAEIVHFQNPHASVPQAGQIQVNGVAVQNKRRGGPMAGEVRYDRGKQRRAEEAWNVLKFASHLRDLAGFSRSWYDGIADHPWWQRYLIPLTWDKIAFRKERELANRSTAQTWRNDKTSSHLSRVFRHCFTCMLDRLTGYKTSISFAYDSGRLLHFNADHTPRCFQHFDSCRACLQSDGYEYLMPDNSIGERMMLRIPDAETWKNSGCGYLVCKPCAEDAMAEAFMKEGLFNTRDEWRLSAEMHDGSLAAIYMDGNAGTLKDVMATIKNKRWLQVVNAVFVEAAQKKLSVQRDACQQRYLAQSARMMDHYRNGRIIRAGIQTIEARHLREKEENLANVHLNGWEWRVLISEGNKAMADLNVDCGLWLSPTEEQAAKELAFEPLKAAQNPAASHVLDINSYRRHCVDIHGPKTPPQGYAHDDLVAIPAPPYSNDAYFKKAMGEAFSNPLFNLLWMVFGCSGKQNDLAYTRAHQMTVEEVALWLCDPRVYLDRWWTHPENCEPTMKAKIDEAAAAAELAKASAEDKKRKREGSDDGRHVEQVRDGDSDSSDGDAHMEIETKERRRSTASRSVSTSTESSHKKRRLSISESSQPDIEEEQIGPQLPGSHGAPSSAPAFSSSSATSASRAAAEPSGPADVASPQSNGSCESGGVFSSSDATHSTRDTSVSPPAYYASQGLTTARARNPAFVASLPWPEPQTSLTPKDIDSLRRYKMTKSPNAPTCVPMPGTKLSPAAREILGGLWREKIETNLGRCTCKLCWRPTVPAPSQTRATPKVVIKTGDNPSAQVVTEEENSAQQVGNFARGIRRLSGQIQVMDLTESSDGGLTESETETQGGDRGHPLEHVDDDALDEIYDDYEDDGDDEETWGDSDMEITAS